jgi:hypothetical protein
VYFYSYSENSVERPENGNLPNLEPTCGALTDCEKKIVAANWKMNLTHKEVKPYLDRFLAEVGEVNKAYL